MNMMRAVRLPAGGSASWRAAGLGALVIVLLIPGSSLVLALAWLWRARSRLPSVTLAGSARMLLLGALLLGISGCSLRHAAIDKLGDSIAEGGTVFASDDDPELVQAAVPFSLKIMESLLAERPAHQGLLLAAAKGFTQYAYAFVQQEADEIEDRDLTRALGLRERARKLYARARDYGMRGLAAAHAGIAQRLDVGPTRAAAEFRPSDVPLLYWTAASWGSLIALSKDDPAVLADIPVVEALIDRALALDESYDRGAIHTFMISYAMVRQGLSGDPARQARTHFERALALAADADIGPLVAFAEAVCVPRRHRAEFEALLARALRFDVNRAAENRLANLVMQRRARWLLAHTEQLFPE